MKYNIVQVYLSSVYCRYERGKKKEKSACWLTGNVGDHDEDEEGVVIKGEVVLVGQSDRVQACLLHVRQCCIDSQQFPGHSHGIQHNEEGVPTAEGLSKTRQEENNKSYIIHWYCNKRGGRHKQQYTGGNFHCMDLALEHLPSKKMWVLKRHDQTKRTWYKKGTSSIVWTWLGFRK